MIHVPGHSAGLCALYCPDRDVLLCGDTLATVDIKTGRSRRPQLMSMFNADRGRAAESLGRVTLLPGHGDPWRGKMQKAVGLARER